jgi:hypothetical protein
VAEPRKAVARALLMPRDQHFERHHGSLSIRRSAREKSDGVYSPTAVSSQCGAMPIFKSLRALDKSISFDGKPESPAAPAPHAVTELHELTLGDLMHGGSRFDVRQVGQSRVRRSTIESQAMLENYGKVVISAFVTLAFAAILTFLLLRPLSVDSDFLKVMIGVLSTKFGTVVDYWLGDAANRRRDHDRCLPSFFLSSTFSQGRLSRESSMRLPE